MSSNEPSAPPQVVGLVEFAIIVGQIAGQASGSTEKVAVQPFVVVTITINELGSVPGVALEIVVGEKVSPVEAAL